MSTILRTRDVGVPGAVFLRLGFALVVALMLAIYVVIVTRTTFLGADFACFRAATILLAHGGNPYDLAQMWRMENALYNHPGTPHYALDRYYNPPLFNAALVPLAGLPLAQGFAIYSVFVVACAALGVWLLVRALGWTTQRVMAVALVLVSPAFFVTLWNGQQSTLLLCALGGALYALRQGRPGLAGALMALTWVKPHLLIPVALAAPLLLADRRSAVRWSLGLGAATALGVALTLVTTGAGSIALWISGLVHYTGYVDIVQSFMPSLPGTGLIFVPRPWNRLLSGGLIALGLGLMALCLLRGHRRARTRQARSDSGWDDRLWIELSMLVATWLLFTPYAHVNDDVLLVFPLAVVWSQSSHLGAAAVLLCRSALWAMIALPLTFLLPWPLSLLGLVPPVLVFLSVFYVWTEPGRAPVCPTTPTRPSHRAPVHDRDVETFIT